MILSDGAKLLSQKYCFGNKVDANKKKVPQLCALPSSGQTDEQRKIKTKTRKWKYEWHPAEYCINLANVLFNMEDGAFAGSRIGFPYTFLAGTIVGRGRGMASGGRHKHSLRTDSEQ